MVVGEKGDLEERRLIRAPFIDLGQKRKKAAKSKFRGGQWYLVLVCGRVIGGANEKAGIMQ